MPAPVRKSNSFRRSPPQVLELEQARLIAMMRTGIASAATVIVGNHSPTPDKRLASATIRRPHTESTRP